MEKFPKNVSKDRFPRRPDKILKDHQYAKNTGRFFAEQLFLQEYKEMAEQHTPYRKQYSPKVNEIEDDTTYSPYEKKLVLEYAKKKKDASRLQAVLLNKLHTDPSFLDAPNTSLADTDSERVLKDFSNFANVLDILYRCKELHLAIEEASSKYPDPSDLYEYVFGRFPEGKIEVIKGPVTIFFKCSNIKDYAWIDQGAVFKHSSYNLTDKDIENAMQSGGCAIAASRIPVLSGALIAENASKNTFRSASIQRHEEEHVIRAIIKNQWYPERYTTEFDGNPELSRKIEDARESTILEEDNNVFFYLDGVPLDLAREHINLVAKQLNIVTCVSGADEILAFFKDGENNLWTTFCSLTNPKSHGGLYDYFQNDMDKLKSTISSSPEVHEIIEEVLLKNKEKYHDLIWYALHSLLELYGTGKYSRDETIAFFDKEPLARWPKVSQRLLQSGI